MAKLNDNLLGGNTVVMVGGQFHLLQVSEPFWWMDHESEPHMKSALSNSYFFKQFQKSCTLLLLFLIY